MTLTNAKEKQAVIIQLLDGLGFSHSDILHVLNGAHCRDVSKLVEPQSEFQQGSYNRIIFGVGVAVDDIGLGAKRIRY